MEGTEGGDGGEKERGEHQLVASCICPQWGWGLEGRERRESETQVRGLGWESNPRPIGVQLPGLFTLVLGPSTGNFIELYCTDGWMSRLLMHLVSQLVGQLVS